MAHLRDRTFSSERRIHRSSNKINILRFENFHVLRHSNFHVSVTLIVFFENYHYPKKRMGNRPWCIHRFENLDSLLRKLSSSRRLMECHPWHIIEVKIATCFFRLCSILCSRGFFE